MGVKAKASAKKTVKVAAKKTAKVAVKAKGKVAAKKVTVKVAAHKRRLQSASTPLTLTVSNSGVSLNSFSNTGLTQPTALEGSSEQEAPNSSASLLKTVMVALIAIYMMW